MADAERPRDTLELLEEELAARRQAAGPRSLDERTEYLTERIATLNALVELRRERYRLKNRLMRARTRHGKSWSAPGLLSLDFAPALDGVAETEADFLARRMERTS